MRTTGKQGFTLIELLIVIAIIGILAAVLIPNLMNARTTAANRAAQAHSSNVYTAFMAALAEDSTASVASLITDNSADAADCAVPGAADNYSWNAAPNGATCAVTEVSGDFNVLVQLNGQSYTNGVDTTTP